MLLGVALLVSGVAFWLGAVCSAIWGPAGDDQIDLYWMGGLLVLLGLASVGFAGLPKPLEWPWVLSRPHSEPTAANMTPDPTTRVAAASPPDPSDLLRELIQLAEVQLAESWAVTRDQNTYALALSALGVALMGVVVAAQSVLGSHWWVPLPGLGVASFYAIIGTRRAHSGLGPDPAAFYATFSHELPPQALAHLLADVLQAQRKVPKTLRNQRIALLGVAALFAVTAGYSIPLLV